MITLKEAAARAGILGGLRAQINWAHRKKQYAKRNALILRYDTIRLERMNEK